MIRSIAVSLASSHEDIIDIDISPGPVNNQTKCNFNISSQGNFIRLKSFCFYQTNITGPTILTGSITEVVKEFLKDRI